MGIVFAAALAGCGAFGGSSPHLVPASEVERASAARKAAVVPAVPPPPIGAARDSARGPRSRVGDARDSAVAPAQGRGSGARVEPTPSTASAPTPGGPGAAARTGHRKPETRQGQWIRVEGPQRRVSFEWAGKGLGDVVSLFAEQSGRDIILAQGVDSVSVTASIRDQEWHLALESVLLAYDLRPVETSSGIILVVPKERAQEARAPESIVLKHRLAGEVEPALRRVLGMDADTVPSGDAVEIIGDSRKSRTLMVHASQDRLAQARSLIAQLDRRPPSVTIEWRQVEVHQDRMQRLGLSYQLGQFRDSLGTVQPGVMVRPTGGLKADAGRAFALLRRSRGGLGALSLEGFVDALAEDGMGETETVQTITVNSDETAEIRVGDAFILPNNQPILAGGGYAPAPFGQQAGGSAPQGSAGGGPGQPGVVVGGFQQFETGTSVRATAYVLSADEVRLDLELTRDGGTLAPDGRSITGGKQTAFTRVTVKNGTPVVIGGLAVKGRSRTNSGVPGLSRLPVIGRLFRNEGVAEQHRDLLIIVTPRIKVVDDES